MGTFSAVKSDCEFNKSENENHFNHEIKDDF